MSIRKIACCTDFSENAETAVSKAIEMAEKFDATLDVLHVLPQPVNPMVSDFEVPLLGEAMPQVTFEHRASLAQKMKEKMQDVYGGRMTRLKGAKMVVLDGHVSTEIITYLEEHDIDLVVLGSYGFSGMGLVLFGSVAKRVAHKAHCSVMIARDKVEK
jgi:universal stress protein A